MTWLVSKITKLLRKRRKEAKARVQPMTYDDFRMILAHEKKQHKHMVKQIEFNAARGWPDPWDEDDKDELRRLDREIASLERHIYNAPLPMSFFEED